MDESRGSADRMCDVRGEVVNRYKASQTRCTCLEMTSLDLLLLGGVVGLCWQVLDCERP